MFCQNCGTQINGGKFCPNCGTAVTEHARRFHNTYTKQTDSYGETYGRAEIEYNGGTAYIYRYDDVMIDWSRGEPVYVIEDWTFLVPKGYTGLMIGYRSGAVEKGGDEYANYSPEDYHLLRLD